MPTAPKRHKPIAAMGKPAGPRRPSPSARGYDRRWQKIRRAYLNNNPVCVLQYEGCLRVASEVDHVVPLRDGGTHDEDNLQAACKPCHSKKTAREDGGFGN